MGVEQTGHCHMTVGQNKELLREQTGHCHMMVGQNKELLWE